MCIDSSLAIKDGAAAANVSILNSTIRGALTVDTGAGADAITLQGTPGELTLFAAVKILSGSGLDAITLAGADPAAKLTAFRPFLIDAGLDTASLSTGPGATFLIAPVQKNII
jgi:hypothetical protein